MSSILSGIAIPSADIIFGLIIFGFIIINLLAQFLTRNFSWHKELD